MIINFPNTKETLIQYEKDLMGLQINQRWLELSMKNQEETQTNCFHDH